MNPKICVIIVLVASALELVNTQLITIAAAGTALAAGSVVLSPALAAGIGAAIIAGGALIKGIAIAGIAGGIGASRGRGGFGGRGGRGGPFGRGRRAVGEPTGQTQEAVPVQEEDLAFALIATTEPDQCYRRLICTLATGSMKPTELDIIPKFLARKEVDVKSAEFEFSNAAKLGESLKNVKACEIRYSCPLTSVEIEKLL